MVQVGENLGGEGRAAIYSVALEVFEGPLDLLLHLVRRHELDILDIPIAFVAEKYLEYLHIMRSLDLEVAGDYLVMAATLAWLKSRELLPPEPREGEAAGAEDEEGEDPREALIRRLVEYERFKSAAAELDSLPMSGRDVFARGADIDVPPMDPGLAPVTLFKLAEAYYRVLTRAKISKSHDVTIEAVTVAQRMQQLTLMLDERQEFDFESLFLGRTWSSEKELRGMLVVTLMSVLELVKLGVARVQQVPDAEAIRVYRLAASEEARRLVEGYDEDQSFGAPPVDLGPAPPSEAELDAAEERALLAEALAGLSGEEYDESETELGQAAESLEVEAPAATELVPLADEADLGPAANSAGGAGLEDMSAGTGAWWVEGGGAAREQSADETAPSSEERDEASHETLGDETSVRAAIDPGGAQDAKAFHEPGQAASSPAVDEAAESSEALGAGQAGDQPLVEMDEAPGEAREQITGDPDEPGESNEALPGAGAGHTAHESGESVGDGAVPDEHETLEGPPRQVTADPDVEHEPEEMSGALEHGAHESGEAARANESGDLNEAQGVAAPGHFAADALGEAQVADESDATSPARSDSLDEASIPAPDDADEPSEGVLELRAQLEDGSDESSENLGEASGANEAPFDSAPGSIELDSNGPPDEAKRMDEFEGSSQASTDAIVEAPEQVAGDLDASSEGPDASDRGPGAVSEQVADGMIDALDEAMGPDELSEGSDAGETSEESESLVDELGDAADGADADPRDGSTSEVVDAGPDNEGDSGEGMTRGDDASATPEVAPGEDEEGP